MFFRHCSSLLGLLLRTSASGCVLSDADILLWNIVVSLEAERAYLPFCEVGDTPFEGQGIPVPAETEGCPLLDQRFRHSDVKNNIKNDENIEIKLLFISFSAYCRNRWVSETNDL